METLTNDAVLTEEQVRSFHENGFLRLESICPPEEVEVLIGVYDRLFASKAGREQGAHFDMVGSDKDDAVPVSPQIINPVFFAPELKETIFRQNALKVARELLGPEASGAFEHAILKPPLFGAPTPWHQDEAFRRNHPQGYEEISIWMPLQPVDESSGCLQFVPKVHRGPVLEHRSPNNDPTVHALECVSDFAGTPIISCPLPAGGCTIHHCRTPHRAGPNSSTNPRRAYILGFMLPTKGRPKFSPEFQWNLEKQTANKERKLAWRRRGGIVVEVLRKIRARITR